MSPNIKWKKTEEDNLAVRGFSVECRPLIYVGQATVGCLLKARIPLGSSHHVSTRHDTFDMSSPCILAVTSLSNSTARHTRHDELDWLVTSNVSYRVETWRAERNVAPFQIFIYWCLKILLCWSALFISLWAPLLLSRSPTVLPVCLDLVLPIWVAFEMQKKMLQPGTKTVYSQRRFRLHGVFPIPFLCVHKKIEVGERIEPFSVGGETSFPCALLHLNHWTPRPRL